MRAEDITPGMLVRVTIDAERFPASDYAYLTRTDVPRRNPEPSVQDETLTVTHIYPDSTVTLIDDTGRRVYLAYPRELHGIGSWTPESLAERTATGECAIADDWCHTHRVEAGLGHYLETRPPEDHGHNPRTGIAYND